MIREAAASSTDPGGSDAARLDRGAGQALVEFALILPLFLLLTLGVVDLARVFASYIALTDGVREAALYAAEGTNNTKWCAASAPDNVPCPPGTDPAVNRDPDPASTDNIAFQLRSAGLEAPDVQLADPICSNACAPEDGTVTISATYDVALITPVLGEVLGASVTLGATTTAQRAPVKPATRVRTGAGGVHPGASALPVHPARRNRLRTRGLGADRHLDERRGGRAVASVSADRRTPAEILDRAMRISPAVPYSAANINNGGADPFYPSGIAENGLAVVDITVDVPIITPIVAQMVGGSVTVTAQAEERVH